MEILGLAVTWTPVPLDRELEGDHKYSDPPYAFRVTMVPGHKILSPVTVALLISKTSTITFDVSGFIQPVLSSTISDTWKVPVSEYV